MRRIVFGQFNLAQGVLTSSSHVTYVSAITKQVSLLPINATTSFLLMYSMCRCIYNWKILIFFVDCSHEKYLVWGGVLIIYLIKQNKSENSSDASDL